MRARVPSPLPWIVTMVLVGVPSAVCGAGSPAATLRFDRSTYFQAEAARALSLALVVVAPGCGGAGFQVLESTVLVRSVAGGSAVPHRDFLPRVDPVPIGGSRTSFPLVLKGLVLNDAAVEGTERFKLALEVPDAARVRCLADGRFLKLYAGPDATVTIEDGGDVLRPRPSTETELRCAPCEVEGQEGEMAFRTLRAELVDSAGEPVRRSGVAVTWTAQGNRIELGQPVSLTNEDGRAEVRAVLVGQAGTEEVRASFKGKSTTIKVRIVAAKAAEGSHGPGDSLCGHLELLPLEAQRLCAQGGSEAAREIQPDEAAAQSSLGFASLALRGHAVRQRLATRSEGQPPEDKGEDGLPLRAGGLYLGTGVESGSRPESAREGGYDYRLRSFQAGFDATTPEGAFLLGGQVGMVEGDADFRGDRGNLSLRALSATAYAAYRNVRETLFLEGFVTWERPRFELHRTIHLDGERRMARSDTGGSQWELSLGARAERPLGAVTLEGRGYLHWDEVALDSFRESGAGGFDLAVEGQRQRSVVAEGGGRLRVRKAFAHWGVVLRAGADAVRELSRGVRTQVWRFANGDPSQPRFSTTAEAPDRDYFNLEAELIADLPGGWQAFLRARKEAQRDDLDSRSCLFGLAFGF